MPLISVIITAYNRVGLVARAVESAARQTYKNIEIVVVDDASQDNTVEVLESLNNPLVRIIKNAKNLGASGAKNIGVENAKGEYIAFLDSDDTWDESKLEIQYAAILTGGLPLCFTATRVHRNNGKIIERVAQRKNSWYQSIMYSETFSLGSTLLASKECLQKVGRINENLVRFEDRDWCLRYFDHYADFIYINTPLSDVYNSSSWVAAETVESSAQRLMELNKQRISNRSRTDYATFCASLKFEIAVAYWRNKQKTKSAFIVLYACASNAQFAKYIASRVMRKIRQLDFF